MKKLILALALVVGTVGISKAGGRQGQGWNVTVVTGTAITVFEGRGYVKKIILSSGTTTGQGEYLNAYKSIPTIANGAGAVLMPHGLFGSTQSIVPSLVYGTTTTVSGTGSRLNNEYGVGDGPNDFIEIPSDGALHIRQPQQATGGANTATVLWSR